MSMKERTRLQKDVDLNHLLEVVRQQRAEAEASGLTSRLKALVAEIPEYERKLANPPKCPKETALLKEELANLRLIEADIKEDELEQAQAR